MHRVTRRFYLVPLGIMVAMLPFVSGCERLPHTTTVGDIQYIHISEKIVPRELYVTAGDEVRWLNDREFPVRIGFLGNTKLDEISCEKGFKHFWMLQDIVTIQAHDYVSLCFSQPAKVRYNIWWRLDDSRGPISRTATIHVRM